MEKRTDKKSSGMPNLNRAQIKNRMMKDIIKSIASVFPTGGGNTAGSGGGGGGGGGVGVGKGGSSKSTTPTSSAYTSEGTSDA